MNSMLPLIGTAAVTENMLKRRWSTIILRHLSRGVNTPEEVISREPGLSAAILTERLRAMLRYGLIARFPRPGPSVVVEFRLTARGRKILRILDLIDQLDELDQELVQGNDTLEQQFGLQAREDAVPRPEATASRSTAAGRPRTKHQTLPNPNPSLP